jgi:hypothetical protein
MHAVRAECYVTTVAMILASKNISKVTSACLDLAAALFGTDVGQCTSVGYPVCEIKAQLVNEALKLLSNQTLTGTFLTLLLNSLSHVATM